MIKRLTVAVAALFALGMQAFGAGTIPYSLSQQLDEFGKPLAGCYLYIIQAGTVSTPQNGYQDTNLTLLQPNPLRCDSAGRLPQFFLADGAIKIRLTKSNGVNVITVDGILVIGPSAGGGGGSPVDATTVLATGDIKARYGTGVLSGFVRLNGRTIGSATSGAAERANADTQALFEYLWSANPNLAVSGGRGASANADWVANKTMTLPDMRGRGLSALADMGNSAATTLTTATCTVATTLGGLCGSETNTIGQVNLPNITWASTLAIANTLGISLTDTTGYTVNNGTNIMTANAGSSFGGGAVGTATNITLTKTGSVSASLTGGVALTGSVTSGGSGTAFGVLNPIFLVTVYVKL
jgi:hypothetical protein